MLLTDLTFLFVQSSDLIIYPLSLHRCILLPRQNLQETFPNIDIEKLFVSEFQGNVRSRVFIGFPQLRGWEACAGAQKVASQRILQIITVSQGRRLNYKRDASWMYFNLTMEKGKPSMDKNVLRTNSCVIFNFWVMDRKLWLDLDFGDKLKVNQF